MIDTINISYSKTQELRQKMDKYRNLFCELSPSGEVIWEKGVMKDFPSSFSGLRVSEYEGKYYFEFSLQKYFDLRNYNDQNTDLEQDIINLYNWIDELRSLLDYDFKSEYFELQRVDFARNYLLEDSKDYLEFFRCIELRLGRLQLKHRRYATTIYYGSRWLGYKLYHKGTEYIQMERKKRKQNGKPEIIVDGRIVRFEMGVKKMYMKKNGMGKICDLRKFRERFDKEAKKVMSVEKFSENKYDLSFAERVLCDLVIERGYQLALQEFKNNHSRRYFYNVRSQLLKKDIVIEALENTSLTMVETPKTFKLRVQPELPELHAYG